jgi:hypothetical protein
MKTITERDVIMCHKIACKVLGVKFVRPSPQAIAEIVKAFNKLPPEPTHK